MVIKLYDLCGQVCFNAYLQYQLCQYN
uniref:Uncharacterized protein n=1 Tax=Anguilla anguilla TaxID=7936 RepID=A0A0E9T529_ANGAN